MPRKEKLAKKVSEPAVEPKATNVKPKAVVMGDPARTVQKCIEWTH